MTTSHLRPDRRRPSQKAKFDVNLALDKAAGRTLTVDERAEWWIESDRFLRMLDEDQYDSLMQEAGDYHR